MVYLGLIVLLAAFACVYFQFLPKLYIRVGVAYVLMDIGARIIKSESAMSQIAFPAKMAFSEWVSKPAVIASGLAHLVLLATFFYCIRVVVNAIKAWRGKTSSKTLGQSASHAQENGDCRKLFPVRKPRHGFDAVFGMSELKKSLGNISHEIGKNGKNGVLLYGDPGNGKTFIAEAWAKEMGLNFLEIRWPEVASKWVNQTSEQVKAAFQAATMQKPCMIFFDEAESMLRDRASMGRSDGTSEVPQTVDAFLTLLNDYHDSKRSGIVIVAATNFPEQLDQAAFREGRFDFKKEIPSPDAPAREMLIQHSLRKGFALEPSAGAKIAPKWEGFSVARIREVTDRACAMAKETGVRQIGVAELKTALRDVQGALGHSLPESTPSLDALHFDAPLQADLNQLATHMMDAEYASDLGAALPRGILFYGPPGVGKTAVAKALAKSTQWAFLGTTGQALQSAPDEMDKLLSKAANLRPCIVFIDEADDIIQDRALNPYGKQATNKLLAAMEGTKPLHDVLFVAATNFRESLDAAAVRDGRFGEHFEFTLPSSATLEQIVRGFMVEKSKAPWAKDFDPVAAAKILDGFAPSDARGRLQKAINRAVANRENITLADLAAVR